MKDSKAGEGRPSQLTSFRAAKIDAAISRTRLRRSSTGQAYHFRFLFAIELPKVGIAA